MAETKVEIEVELTGSQKVEKKLEDIEGGLEGLGETGSKLVKSLGTTNEKLGEGLESVSSTVGEVSSAFGGLGDAIKQVGEQGPKGFVALLGPLGMLVSAGLAVFETFKLISGAALEAEEAQEAMNAAASDLQSKLEALAEKGVILSTQEFREFSKAVLESQLAKERIQFQFEKQKKIFMETADAQKELNRLTRISTDLEKEDFRTRMEAMAAMTKARRRLAKAIQEEEKAIARLTDEQSRAEVSLRRAGEMEQELEKRSTDQLRADALKLANLEKEANLIETRNTTVANSILQIERLGEIEVDYLKTKERLEDASRAELIAETEAIKQRRKNLTEASIAQMKADEMIRQRREKEQEDEIKQFEAQQKTLREKRKVEREQRRRKDIALQSQLNQIGIRMTKDGIDQEIALENERHRATLQLLKENSKEAEVEEQKHLLNMSKIFTTYQSKKDAERAAELESIQVNNQKKIDLETDFARRMIEMEEFEGATDFGKVEFESNKRLELLQIEFDREIELAKMKGEEITSLEEKFALERLAIQKETVQEQTALITDYFDKYASGFVEAAYGAIFFGESFQESVAQILRGLGEQAAVQALLETAEGISKLAGGNPAGVANLKSAALFAAAAAAAGVASNALGGGGTATAGGTVSPTGTPTTAPTPERERAEESTMVFNINFGGAVVYDTKKAAEQALADRLVTIMNTPRRGAVQFNRR